MVNLEYAALYGGVNILILLVLAYLVVRLRQTHKIKLGYGGNEVVERAVRAHANAAEYIPAGMAGLTLLALMEPAAPTWLLHAAGISLTVGRLAHAFGLHAGALNFGRVFGIVLTWISYLLIAGGLIYAGLAGRL